MQQPAIRTHERSSCVCCMTPPYAVECRARPRGDSGSHAWTIGCFGSQLLIQTREPRKTLAHRSLWRLDSGALGSRYSADPHVPSFPDAHPTPVVTPATSL